MSAEQSAARYTFEQVRDAIVQRMSGHTFSLRDAPAVENVLGLLAMVKESECALPSSAEGTERRIDAWKLYRDVFRELFPSPSVKPDDIVSPAVLQEMVDRLAPSAIGQREQRYEKALQQIANMHSVVNDQMNRVTLIAAANVARAALNDTADSSSDQK